jgi:ATP-dependent RNA helicase SUPV3L1/SUV3
LKKFVVSEAIKNEQINFNSNEIDYLETSIKCVELYQWLARHFSNKNFEFELNDLLDNKLQAIEKLNVLLSDKITPTCSSCGCKLPEAAKFPICEECFKERRFVRRGPPSRNYRGNSGGDRPSNLQAAKGSTNLNFRQGKPTEGKGPGKPSKKRKFQGKRR